MVMYPKPLQLHYDRSLDHTTLYGEQYDYSLTKLENYNTFAHWVSENEFYAGFEQSFDKTRIV